MNSFRCSVCRINPRRDGQRTCTECHAASERERRAERRDELTRLRSIESTLLELLADGRKGPKAAPARHVEETRRRA
jgi:hypothetical protein